MTFNYVEVKMVATPTTLQVVLNGARRGHHHDKRCQERRSVRCGRTTCSWSMSLHAATVFDALPTSSVVHDQLSITFVVLVLHCSVYNDVKTVSNGERNTLFEMDGFFLQILEYRVKLASMNSSSRNSSVFMQYAVVESKKRRQVFFLEVNALLDRLFRHVRRFVTSNPLTSNIRSVVVAFYCGAYNGKSDPDSYGNLGAPIATILLLTRKGSLQ